MKRNQPFISALFAVFILFSGLVLGQTEQPRKLSLAPNSQETNKEVKKNRQLVFGTYKTLIS